MRNLRPTQDVHFVIRMQLDAHSIAQRAYEKAWVAACKENRPLPEPPSVPTGGPIIRTDVIKIHLRAPEPTNN
jgi:hypothetical protein